MNATWDDRDPLAALRAGDAGPFEDFVRREIRGLHGFFRHLGADPDEAEDLAQELCVRLYRSGDAYRPEGRFRGFVFRVARNVWIDRRRARGAADASEAGEDERELPSAEPEPGELLALKEEAERARRALRALAEPHRLAFELGVVRELPYAEVARVLDVPVGTVKSRVHHAARKLREALGLPQEVRP